MMSTQAYDVGDQVRLSYIVASTGSTNPTVGTVPKLVVTSPTAVDSVVAVGSMTAVPSSDLAEFTTKTDTTSQGVGGWYYDFTLTAHGRWTYQFRSTGTITASEGGAFAVARPLASTST